ncbi:putative L-type lectin-domain containing receptor kinase S.7 [Dorcoceras hygrometricum]|uniref:non-specific serine/threonine protein kinase n=1 Tax=Dorcoceras hygrometricum TaxID=472368 RepID=A0A2Z7CLJ3_9LAMI|nr:putative L-type lectin-domain containing receptor kinase S.7 [Dorcoceras hygrometricum]
MLLLIIAVLIHYNLFDLAESHNFSYPSFDSASCADGSNLICWGSVSSGNGSLQITPHQSQQPKDTNEVGRVLYRNPVLAWPSSFSTTFTIKITSNSTASGDGMSFILAQDNGPSPPESYGSFVGILDPSTEGGVVHQLAVELDTYKNPREIDGNHMAIVTTSMERPVAVRSLSDIGINIHSGRNIRIKIEYDGWEKLLQIHAAYAGDCLVEFLSQKIILQDTVPQEVFVGFTGSTGHLPEVHHVLDWNFTMYELPKVSLSAGVGKTKGRKVWEIAAPIIVTFSVAVMVLVAAALKRRMLKHEKRDDMEKLTKNAANGPRYFTYKQLSRATRNFRKENLLGTGGFGSVYKGVLSDADFSNSVAVKKVNATSNQGEREFLAEICTIGRLRHKNLVQLHGWCHDRKQLLLVYEYMPNGSLDRYIGKDFLDWNTRYKILSGLASVLLYLHEECGSPVVHRDVKPNNVMLDSDFNAHLGDFGLARILQNNVCVTTMVAGTIGYLAPEVSFTGRATLESDVYSFGMVVIELVCGRRSKAMMEEFSLVDHVWNSLEKGLLISSVDQMLGGKFDKEQARRSLMVGLACLHPDQMLRPTMRKVVQVFLNPDEPLMDLPESRPTEVCLSLPSSSPSTTLTDTGSIAPHYACFLQDLPDEMTMKTDS